MNSGIGIRIEVRLILPPCTCHRRTGIWFIGDQELLCWWHLHVQESQIKHEKPEKSC